jgi:hypothetical protein
VGSNDHEEVVLDVGVIVVVVVVIDGRNVEDVLALLAVHEGFIAVEAEP